MEASTTLKSAILTAKIATNSMRSFPIAMSNLLSSSVTANAKETSTTLKSAGLKMVTATAKMQCCGEHILNARAGYFLNLSVTACAMEAITTSKSAVGTATTVLSPTYQIALV